MSDIVTDISINKNWNIRIGAHNSMTFTFTQSGAFNISGYTFSLQIRRFGSSSNLISLTQGSGLTNGGSNGILTAVLTSAQTSTLSEGEYYWQLTVIHPDTFTYRWFNGTLRAFNELYTGDTASNVAATIALTGGNVTVSITLSGGGAGSDTTAIHDNEAGEISAITEKTMLVDADLFLIEDSAAANAKKRVQRSNIIGFNPSRRILNKNNVTDSFTGTTVETIVTSHSFLVSAGVIAANDVIEIVIVFRKSGATSTLTNKIYVNSSLSLSGATLIATLQNSSGVLFNKLFRQLVFKNSVSSQEIAVTTGSFNSDITSSSTIISTLSLDFSTDQYFIISQQLGSAADTAIVASSYFEIIRT